MKKSVLVTVLFSMMLVFTSPIMAQEALPQLPSAGITPTSPFYFLDRATEALRGFLTFRAQSKAKLHASRALERIAEVKAMLLERDIDADGIDIALDRLEVNAQKAAAIVEDKHKKGEDVSVLAKQLDTDFELRERLLERVFEDKKDQVELVFKQQKVVLKKQLFKAILAEDVQKIGELTLVIKELKQRHDDDKNLLELKEESLEGIFELEEEKFELALKTEERALELKEKETKLILKQHKRALKQQFKEAEDALKLKEDSLDMQFNLVVAMGDDAHISDIRAKLTAFEEEEIELDSKFDSSKLALNKVERDFDILILQEERALEDFTRQEKFVLEKMKFEMEHAAREKKLALKSKFKAQKNELSLQKKQLELAIIKAEAVCRQIEDISICLTETVKPLQEQLAQVKRNKDALKREKDAMEDVLELEEEQFEQALELKEKEAELKEEVQEQLLEEKEKRFEQLQEQKKDELDRVKDEAKDELDGLEDKTDDEEED